MTYYSGYRRVADRTVSSARTTARPPLPRERTPGRPGDDLHGPFGAPAQDVPPESPAWTRRLHHFFEKSCDDRPTATALVLETEELSYRELDERANRLAHFLIETGVEPGMRVALLLERSGETYVALLATLKAGAAFVPIDPTVPCERVQYITDDCAVDLVLSTSSLDELTRELNRKVLRLDHLSSALTAMPATRPVVLSPGDPAAYVIYTSGSSGRPKGVEVAQSSICNFIGIVPDAYDVRPDDRVYQGMTIAFDFSIEEIWPTWAHGATLVAGPNDSRRLGADLADFLEANRVTVLYCVPTVLATLDRTLPLLRSLVVGGEACPAELVERWAGPGRRILNTYGPTETTVTATWCELVPGRTVTIGVPLPTYTAHVLDIDTLAPVTPGEVGEICVGGPGVARGYVGRPELTASRFLPNPFPEGGRLYRTGDLGRVLGNGEIEYLGRADTEVKIRGHRVDLQEIENVLREHAGVSDAVTALVPVGDTKELAAYVTRSAQAPPDEMLTEDLHGEAVRRLPPYMVPSYLVVLDVLPMLPSGKADRQALPAPVGGRLIATTGDHVPPSSRLERELCELWGSALGVDADRISVDADFFLDLGGHSLAAATTVSLIRRRPDGAGLAVGDLYTHPTVASLAVRISQAAAAERPEVPERPAALRPRRGLVALCGGSQALLLYVLLLLFSLPVAVIYELQGGVVSRTVLIQLLATLPATYLLGRWALPVIGCRLLSVRLRPGRYPLWGATYLRIWLLQKLMALSPASMLAGSPLLPPYLRLLGARVGRGTHIASAQVTLPHLLVVGDRATVGYGVHAHPFSVEDGWVTVAPVVIGPGAVIGASCLLDAGARVGTGAGLAEHSMVARDQVVPAQEYWAGSPARPSTEEDPARAAMAECSQAPLSWSLPLLAGFGVGLVGLELLPLAVLAPSMVAVWAALLAWGVGAGVVATVLAGPLYVLTTCLFIAMSRRAVLPSTPVGVLHLRTGLGLQKWVADKLLELSLSATNALYATLYTAPWLRLLGARIGRGSEVSTVAHIDPDLLVLGDGSFVADMASIGSASYANGHMALRATEVGRRAFVGNAAFVPAGTHLQDESLIGVHTVPPVAGVPAGSSWLGSPAIFLPRRQDSGSFAEGLTFRPSRWRVAERLVIEFGRMTLPASLLGLAAFGGLYAVSAVAAAAGMGVVVAATPAIFLTTAVLTVLVAAAVKWCVIGAYRPRVEPLWSRFVRRSEFVTGLYEAAAVPVLLQSLTGTPLIGPMLRLFGTRVGRRAWIDTTYLTEFDLVRIGSDAVVSTGASLQTHLFEDRVMKMSTVDVQDGAGVGPRSVVLYDATVGTGSRLGPLSLVMKGEDLMPGTSWSGIPAQTGT